MTLTTDQRIAYVQQVLAAFCVQAKRKTPPNHIEYDLARRWALSGVPLATVLQGIAETTGKPRTLMACERAVNEQISRWHSAVGGLRELPEPGPLEPPEELPL